MNNLAISYDDSGRREEALKLKEELLPLSRKGFGPEHPATLTAMNNLAESYDEAGRRDEALKAAGGGAAPPPQGARPGAPRHAHGDEKPGEFL